MCERSWAVADSRRKSHSSIPGFVAGGSSDPVSAQMRDVVALHVTAQPGCNHLRPTTEPIEQGVLRRSVWGHRAAGARPVGSVGEHLA